MQPNAQRMTLTTAKFSDLALRTPLSPASCSSQPFHRQHSSTSPFFHSSQFRSTSILRHFSSSLRTSHSRKYSENANQRQPTSKNPAKTTYSAPWVDKWPPMGKSSQAQSNRHPGKLNGRDRSEKADAGPGPGPGAEGSRYDESTRGQSAIDRIVLRLRNLGLGSDDEDEDEEGTEFNEDSRPTGEEKLGDLLNRDWIRPDMMLEEEQDDDLYLLPWEKEEREVAGKVDERDGAVTTKRKIVKAPSLAELTIEDPELRRLRRMGMVLRERVNVPKAGVTQAVLEKIHDKWRKNELVRLKFHEALAHDMKKAHEITERRTGGLVIWRSGSVMVVYRGINYEGPTSRSLEGTRSSDSSFIPDVSSPNGVAKIDGNKKSLNMEKTSLAALQQKIHTDMTPEEIEFNGLLDNLGPRFVDWWGTGILPVDGDLLPQTIPGFKPPFRLLPVGMRSGLTNAELTDLRKQARSLPCHFALGRNRHHQGLAAAIIKLWEKTSVVKIAVKQGIQNTNNELMAEEIKRLTGGVLLLRNKFYIIIFRGKDFLSPSVAAALAEREEITKRNQDAEEKARSRSLQASSTSEDEQPRAGTLAEFYEAQSRWGREVSTEEHEKMIEEASRAKILKAVKRIEHKLSLAQAKKKRAERLLSKIEASMVPVGPSDDLETITDEERFMFRRVGLKMKAYLPLGVRGIFDGVIENMHLHWKHRELVKLISKQKTLAFVEESARLLEYESGGILVAIERIPKGFALIYYRGKNYQRPVSLRPRNLLTKAKALKRSVAMQRHEALSQHILELENNIEKMKTELGDAGNGVIGTWSSDGESDTAVSEDEDDKDPYSDDSDEEHDDDFGFEDDISSSKDY